MQKNAHSGSISTKTAVVASIMAVAVALLDGVFKYVALHYFANDAQPMTWPVALALHKNPGVIFDIAVPLFVILPVTALLVIVLLIVAQRQLRSARGQSVALLWIVIGAAGNAIDRITNHFTTDYLIFFQRSAVNLSDILIIAGAILYLYYSRHILPEDTKN